MAGARNNELKFQRLFEHHPIWGQSQHAKHLLIRYLG